MDAVAPPSVNRAGSKPAQRGRSAVSNGTRLFVQRPGDTAWARRFRDVLYELVMDAAPGGFDELSEAQKQLARRAAAIAVMCERLEGKAAAGEDIDLNVFGQLTDRLGRTLSRLCPGLKRQARDVTSLGSVLRAGIERQRETHRHDRSARTQHAGTLAARAGTLHRGGPARSQGLASRSNCSRRRSSSSSTHGRPAMTAACSTPTNAWARLRKLERPSTAPCMASSPYWYTAAAMQRAYCLANDFEQAQGRVFTAIRQICESSPLLMREANITQSRISFPQTGAVFQALGRTTPRRRWRASMLGLGG